MSATNKTIQTIQHVSNEYHFYLLGPIEEEKNYLEFLHMLRTATQSDQIHIHISSPGGYVSTMAQIIHTMEQSEAELIGHLEGICHSAATFIFLSCDRWFINENSMLLFHALSGSFWGESHKAISCANAMHEWGIRYAEKCYFPFLSRKEIKKLTEGKDIWMFGDEVAKRIEDNVIPHREKLIEEQEAKLREDAKHKVMEFAASCQESDS